MRKTNNENEYRVAKVLMSSIYGIHGNKCFDRSSCYPSQLVYNIVFNRDGTAFDVESTKIPPYIDTDGGF